jgi:hypothetical protein
MDNKRSFTRRQLVYYLSIFDRETGELLGNLVDITPEGLMLMAKTALTAGMTYYLRIELPEMVGGVRHLDVDACAQWSRKGANPDYFDVGLKLLDSNGRDVDTIVRLIADYACPS